PGIGDLNMIRIPQSRSAQLGHLGIADDQSVIMPERVSQIEKVMLRLHIPALLKCALTVRRTVKGAVLYQNITAPVKGAFFIKCLILNDSHIFYLHLNQKNIRITTPALSLFPLLNLVYQIIQAGDSPLFLM